MTNEELEQTNKDLVQRVTQLESINSDLVDQKKELKSKLQSGITDESVKAELDNLKSLLESSDSEKQKLISDHGTEINGMRMLDSLREAGVKAQNSDAMSAIADLVLDGSDYDNGFVWKNEDGSTVYNESNKPYGIVDKINELKESEKAYLFEAAVGGGGVTTPPTTKPTQSINDIINAGLKY